MQRIALPLIVLVVLGSGCDRNQATLETPDAPPVGAEESADAGPASEATKPAGCDDVEDCGNKGAIGFLSDDPNAVAMLDYACSGGSATACQNLSTAFRSGRVAEDPAGAHAAAKRGCELGNAAACVDLGVDQSMGLGGATRDDTAALEHFTKACDAGAANGCRYVGVLHHEGRAGSAVDSVTALKWFSKACDMADPESCFNLGVLLVNDVAGEGKLAEAQVAMARGCELGDQDACAAMPEIASAMESQTAKVPGANLRIGEATVDGFTVQGLECRVEGGGMGLLGNMALIGSLGKKKSAIDKCGKKGTAVEVRWTSAGGRITTAEGVGTEGACVAKLLKKLATPTDGECAATFVLGS